MHTRAYFGIGVRLEDGSTLGLTLEGRSITRWAIEKAEKIQVDLARGNVARKRFGINAWILDNN